MFRTLLPLILSLAGGCVDCTLDLRTSARLTVLDESGSPVDDADVECFVDGAEVASGPTVEGQFDCGQELEGDFELEISKPGFEPQTLEFTVDADACHVITESREVTLVAERATGG